MFKRSIKGKSVVALVAACGGPLGWGLAVAEDNGSLEEIVVTAQRREETLQKTSLAIQVVGAGQLEQSGVTSARDLNVVVPGLQIAQGGTATQVFIRGVGDVSASQLSNPGVAFNIDGVYVARPQAIGTGFYDVERVEVLKGPQGTLYGRNSSGGAINLITKKPDFNGVSGTVSFEAGNYSLKHLSGAINVPLSSTFALRGAFDVVYRNGYLTDGTDDDKHESARIHALWNPTDKISWLTTIEGAHTHGEGPGYVPNPRAPGSSPFVGSTDPTTLGYFATQLPLGALIAYGAPPAGAFGLSGPQNGLRPIVDNTSLNISSQFTDDLGWATLTVLPAYRDFRDDERNYPGFMNQATFHSKEFSSEVRLNQSTERIKWAAGVYYFLENQSGHTHIDEGVPQVSDFQYPTNHADSYAAFGEITYSVIDTLRVIGGARYTLDDRRIAGSGLTLNFLTPPLAATTFSGSHRFKAASWKAGLEYDVAPDSMLYLTASTGYKSGGFNQEAAPNLYGPEKLLAYELGMRNRFFENRLQANVEVFKWDYKDHQESIITFDNTFTPNFLIANAGRAELAGASLDIVGKATTQDTFRGYVEYNHTRYSSFTLQAAAFGVVPGVSTTCGVGASPAGPAFLSLDCAGFQLARAPLWTSTVSWEHKFPLPNSAEITALVDANLGSTRWLAADFTPNERAPSYVTENFNLTYTPQGARWSVTGFVRNISDRQVASGAQLQLFQPTSTFMNVNPPRTYGGRVTFNF